MTSPLEGQADRHVEIAAAKINLGLKILGRRDDGYHDICSIAQTVDLADRLEISVGQQRSKDMGSTNGDRVTSACSDPALSTGLDNLVRRAVGLFEAQLRQPLRPLSLYLDKQIPLGAGLGGGSADAAAALRGLNIIYGQPLAAKALTSLAAQLGSDVPFQFAGGTAVMRGRGELLQPLVFAADVCYVLIYPGIHVSSSWAYDQVAAARDQSGASLTAGGDYFRLVTSLRGGCVDHESLFRCLDNDFWPLVERTYPIVATLGSCLDAAGAIARSMSGSGSTIYGVFDDRTAASEACEGLRARGYRSFLCRPVSVAGVD